MGVRGEWDSDGNLVVDPRSAYAQSGAKSRFWRREGRWGLVAVGYADSLTMTGTITERTYSLTTDWFSVQWVRKTSEGVQVERERRAAVAAWKRSEMGV